MPGIILDCRYAWSRAPHTSHTQGTPCVRCPCSLQRACCAVHSVARGPSANQEGLALCQAHSRAMVSTLEHPRALYRGHLEHPIALYAGRRHLRRRTGSCCRCCRCRSEDVTDRSCRSRRFSFSRWRIFCIISAPLPVHPSRPLSPPLAGACRCLLNYPLHMPSHTCTPSNARRMCIQPYAHHDKKIKERPA